MPAHHETDRDVAGVTHRTADAWHVAQPYPTTCEHRDDDLCGGCALLLADLLLDATQLARELRTAARKDVSFAPRGWREGDEEHPNESPVPYNMRASELLDDLHRVLRLAEGDAEHVTGDTRHRLLTELSKVASKTHRLIDRPKHTTPAGPCPGCGEDLQAERGGRIRCDCGYGNTWDGQVLEAVHELRDGWLPIHDLVIVLRERGELISRRRIRHLVERHNLPRELQRIPTWMGNSIKVREVWCYRPADVLALQNRLDAPRPETPAVD